MVRKLDLIESKTLRSPQITFGGTLESAKLSAVREAGAPFFSLPLVSCAPCRICERDQRTTSRGQWGGAVTGQQGDSLLNETGSLFWKREISETRLERDFACEVAIPAHESALAGPVFKAILCESRSNLSAGCIVDNPRFAHRERFSSISRPAEQATACRAASLSWAHDHPVGIWYSTHFTLLPSKLTSIATLINSFPARYRMAASNMARWIVGAAFGTMMMRPAWSSMRPKSRIKSMRLFVTNVNSVGQFPVRFATQAKMIDVGCFESAP